MKEEKSIFKKRYYFSPPLILPIVFLLLIPDFAHAAGTLGSPAWIKVLQTIVDYMTGETGRLLATIAVAGLGYSAYTGRISWSKAITIAIGIGIVFGAANIVDLFAGGY